MRTLHVFTAGLLLASALFVATMLLTPPTSEAAAVAGDPATSAAPIEIAGP